MTISVMSRSTSSPCCRQTSRARGPLCCLKQSVAEIPKQPDDERPHTVLVLHDENRFAAARRWRLLRCCDGDGSLSRHSREEHPKLRAPVDLTIHFNPAAVLLDDPVGGRQPEARSLADVLGGEERFEDVRKVLRCDAGPVVADAQTRPGRDRRGRRRVRARGFDERCVDREPSANRHGITRVDGQVQEHLFDHAGIGANGERLLRVGERHDDVFTEHPVQESRDIRDDAIEIDVTTRRSPAGD